MLSRHGTSYFIGSPVFYGALSAETAVKELMIQDRRIKKDDHVFISEWKVNCPPPLYLASLLYPENTFQDTLYEQFDQMSGGQYDELVGKEKDFDGAMHKKVYQKIGEYFIRAGKESYPLTAFIINNLFYGAKDPRMNTPIVIYPSVSGNFNGINFAIERNFAERHLELKNIQYGSFGGFLDEGFLMHSSNLCEVIDGNISWFDFTTQLYHAPVGVEFNFGELPDEVGDSETVFMIDDHELDLRALADHLIKNESEQIYKHIPRSFKANEIPFERKTQPIPIVFKPQSVYVVHKGERFYLQGIKLHFDYRFEKKPIFDRASFVD